MATPKKRPTGPLALELLGQSRFLALDTTASAGKRWKKDILRVGSWTHPDTGEVIAFTAEDLDAIASDTTRWSELGHKVYLPATHSNDPRDNTGWVPRVWREGDTLFGEVLATDASVAGKIADGSIADVSPRVNFGARASNGETFAAVIEHVALTPSPVVPGQGDFIPFARASKAPDKEQPPVTDPTKTDETPAAGASMSPKDLLKVLAAHYGLKLDAEPQEIWDAILKEEDGEDEVEGADPAFVSSPAYMSRRARVEKAAQELATKISGDKVAKLSRQLEQVQKERSAEKTARNEKEIELARDESAKAGLPLPKERTDLAKRLFAKGEDEAARELLGAHVGHAKDRLSLSRGTVQFAKGVGTETEDEARETEAEKFLLEGSGATFETDDKGRVKRGSIKPPRRDVPR